MTPRQKRAIGALVVVVLALAIVFPILNLARPTPAPPVQRTAPERDCGLLSRFGSEEELREHVKDSPSAGPWIFNRAGGLVQGPAAAELDSYSGTNVQVQGVDESDFVKTDGSNIYASTWGPNGTETAIVRAFPPAEAAMLARIPSEGWDAQLFVSGDRLVVLTGAGGYAYAEGIMAPYWEPRTSILAYDISDPTAPVLAKNVTVSGWLAGARLIGDVLYAVVNAYVWADDTMPLVLPTIWTNGVPDDLKYSDIGHFRDSSGSHVDTIVLAISIRTDDPPAFESFFTNGAAQLYVSHDAVYIAGAEWVFVNDRVVAETSVVHKVTIVGAPRYLCSALIPGTILNQFSMDEHEGHLRVATTFGQWTPEGRHTSSGVYVFDGLLNPNGQVVGLAPGERIFSARFLGERAYLVTYRQVDPLFVLDVSDPNAPRVLGFLKIPGVSTYLHPYGDRYLIGLGMDDPGGTGRLQGVKLSLFDVSDVEHPMEVSTYVIGGGENSYAYSEAQYDHRAFLFVPVRDLVVLPIVSSAWDSYGAYESWAGAYVVAVSPNGLSLQGTVQHSDRQDSWSGGVRRSLYIGEFLYTVSNATIVVSDLDTLAEVAHIAL